MKKIKMPTELPFVLELPDGTELVVEQSDLEVNYPVPLDPMDAGPAAVMTLPMSSKMTMRGSARSSKVGVKEKEYFEG